VLLDRSSSLVIFPCKKENTGTIAHSATGTRAAFEIRAAVLAPVRNGTGRNTGSWKRQPKCDEVTSRYVEVSFAGRTTSFQAKPLELFAGLNVVTEPLNSEAPKRMIPGGRRVQAAVTGCRVRLRLIPSPAVPMLVTERRITYRSEKPVALSKTDGCRYGDPHGGASSQASTEACSRYRRPFVW